MNFAIQGIAVGLPWNSLLVATDLYRDRITTTELAKVESTLTTLYLFVNLATFSWLNRPWRQQKESITTEIGYVYVYYFMNLACFTVLTSAPWFPDSGSRDESLFAIILCAATVMGCTSALGQHALLAFTARSGPSSTQAYLLGFALSGAIASAFSAAMGSQPAQSSGSAIFGLALVSLVSGLASSHYKVLPRVLEKDGEEALIESESVGENSSQGSSTLTLVDKTKYRIALLLVSLSLAGTLSVFPGFVSSIKPQSSSMTDAEFTLILFLLFNLGDATGRLLSGCLLRELSDKMLLFMIMLRTISLGLFLLCYRGVEKASIFGTTLSDESSMALLLIQAIIGGMLFTAGAMRAPEAVRNDPGAAGKVVASIIALSLAIGALCGSLLVEIVG